MTKHTKPKATSTVAPTINSTAPTSPIENVKAESKAKVASKPKQANSTAKKAPSKSRARSKKVTVEGHFKPTEENLNKLVESSEAAYQKYKETGKLSGTTRVVDPEPPKYEQFKAWLVFKLYVVTSLFRTY
jgi:hypothetical protein